MKPLDIGIIDSSSLIVLWQCDLIEVLRELFEHLIVPDPVRQESMRSVPQIPGWMLNHQANGTPPPCAAGLGRGERAVIALASITPGSCAILDDRQARACALEQNLPVIGTVGVLLEAHREGLLSELQPSLDAVRAHGFYLSDNLYRQVLIEAENGR